MSLAFLVFMGGWRRGDNMGNAWAGLLRSRKFWLLVLDTVVSIALYFVGKYAGAGVYEDMQFTIGILQPVFIAIITAIAIEDAAAKRAKSE